MIIFRVLGITAGIVSMTTLAWQGFDFRFNPFLQGVLEYIEDDYRIFFGIFEPFIKSVLAELRDVFG